MRGDLGGRGPDRWGWRGLRQHCFGSGPRHPCPRRSCESATDSAASARDLAGATDRRSDGSRNGSNGSIRHPGRSLCASPRPGQRPPRTSSRALLQRLDVRVGRRFGKSRGISPRGDRSIHDLYIARPCRDGCGASCPCQGEYRHLQVVVPHRPPGPRHRSHRALACFRRGYSPGKRAPRHRAGARYRRHATVRPAAGCQQW
jgi:hypothetical protein